MKTILSALGLSLLIFTSCGGQKKVEVDFIQDNIDNAVAQNTIQTDIIEKSGKILNQEPSMQMVVSPIYLLMTGAPVSFRAACG